MWFQAKGERFFFFFFFPFPPFLITDKLWTKTLRLKMKEIGRLRFSDVGFMLQL